MSFATTKGFRTCSNKGFHIRFDNGWIVSVQFGGGNYCENFNLLFDRLVIKKKPDLESSTAEVWCWDGQGNNYPKDGQPLGHQLPSEVLKILNKISKRKGDAE